MSDRWSVIALRYATRPTTRADVFYRYGEYREPDGPQEMAYYLWVLRNRTQTIVVDTGYSRAGAARRGRRYVVEPLAALRRVGVDAAAGEVDLVLNTHLHYDHTGHLDAFGDAPLLVNRTEFEFWAAPLARREQFAAHVEPDEVEAVARRGRSGQVTLMEAEHEVAPGVVAVEVGGHSPGQTILLIDGETGPIVLASDAVHFYEELERDRACGILVDLGRVYRAYDTIRAHGARGARILAGHDPLVMERFPRLDADPELGVRVA